MIMKKTTAALVGAAAFALSATPAIAGQDTPGTPGTPNCKGQSAAYLAQNGKLAGFPGLGNVAKALDVSVKEVHDLFDLYCAGP
jgi:hypothetical protein